MVGTGLAIQLKLNGQQILMQVDTGAAVAIIAEATQQCSSLELI